MIFFAQGQVAGDGFLSVGTPVFMEAEHKIFIPGAGNAIVVVAPAVAFNDKHVVRVHGADGGRNGAVEVPKGFIELILFAVLVLALESPVRFVQKVISAYPWLVGVALGQFPPQGNRLLAIWRAVP